MTTTEPPQRERIWPVGTPPQTPTGPPPPEHPGFANRLRAMRYTAAVTVAFILGINLLLLAAYVWSRGGQATHIRIEARGDAYFAYIDGHLRQQVRLAGADHGGIVVTIGDTQQPPSMPGPRGLDSVIVTDIPTGTILFADEFPSGPAPTWESITGAAYVGGGVIGARDHASLILVNEPWRDYAVDATFRNGSSGAIIVRAQGPETGVSYSFGLYRDYSSRFDLLNEGTATQSIPGPAVELQRSETVKSLVAMALHAYPVALALLGIGLLATAALQFANVRQRTVTSSLFAPALGLLVSALVIFAFVVTLYFLYSYGQRMPHTPDEVGFLFQAKLLAAVHVTAPPPPVADAFEFFSPPLIVAAAGRWIGISPFGHPLWLSVGVKAHAVWLMPPLAGAASAALLFLIARKIYNARAGALATLLLVTSPFYLMNASTFMSQNTAALYLLGALACIAYAKSSPYLLGALGGLSFGLFFNTQPLSAVAMIAPFSLLLLSELLPRDERGPVAAFIGVFAAVSFVMLGFYFLYNRQTTGDAFTSALQLAPSPGPGLLWGGANSPSIGIQNQQAQLSTLLLALNGWPLYAGLTFVLLPFILATRHRWDWALLAAAVSAMGVYVLYIDHGITYGPRFWYVTLPLLLLLTARGAELAGERLGDVAARARRAITHADLSARWAGVGLAYLVLAALVGSSVYGWLLGRHPGWQDPSTPAAATDLQHFNGVDDRLVTLVDSAHLQNALVLVNDDCTGDWGCYASLFWKNTPALDGDIVYARDIAARRSELLKTFPNRFVYLATYEPQASLTAYPSTGPAPGAVRGPLQALRAKDITVAAPAPTPSSQQQTAAERDAQRMRDLQTIAAALQTYHERHGSYPLAVGMQTLCVYKELDAGCSLLEVLDPLPRDPVPNRAYRYQSNGQSFVVEAIMEQPPSASTACPTIPQVDPTLVYCVRGP